MLLIIGGKHSENKGVYHLKTSFLNFLLFCFFLGELPEWLRGKMVTSGAGKFDFKHFTSTNWIDGYCMLQSVDIEPHKVKLAIKCLQSEAYQKATEHQRPMMVETATPASGEASKSKSFFSKLIPTFVSVFIFSSQSNIA